MKTKLITLLGAILLSIGLSAQVSPSIYIDGNFSDWEEFSRPTNLRYTEASTNENAVDTSLYDMKWITDDNFIAFYMEFSAGDGVVNMFDVFMNVDDNEATGYNGYMWTNLGADYLIEWTIDGSNGLYYYPANADDNWRWESTGIDNYFYLSPRSNLSNGHIAIEGAIFRSKIPEQIQSLKVGVFTSNTNWAVTGCLPQRTINGNGVISKSPTLEVPLLTGTYIYVGGTDSGVCGSDIAWKIENDTLFLSGSGDMIDYNLNYTPWYPSRESIHTVSIDNEITNIGRSAFSYCSNLNSVTIPNKITTIGSWAFYRSRLTNIVISNSVESIGDYAFYECDSLTQISIPNSVTSIGSEAFHGSGLSSIILSNSINCIEAGTFMECSHLTSITMPNSLTVIKENAFRDCVSLSTITIPNSVTNIENHAFRGCSNLTSVIFGSGLNEIKEGAFNGCANIQTMTCYSLQPPTVGRFAFASVPNSIKLFVPSTSLSLYQSHEVWGQYDVHPIETEVPMIEDQSSSSSYKIIENGSLYILLPDGTRYDATGKKVE